MTLMCTIDHLYAHDSIGLKMIGHAMMVPNIMIHDQMFGADVDDAAAR